MTDRLEMPVVVREGEVRLASFVNGANSSSFVGVRTVCRVEFPPT